MFSVSTRNLGSRQRRQKLRTKLVRSLCSSLAGSGAAKEVMLCKTNKETAIACHSARLRTVTRDEEHGAEGMHIITATKTNSRGRLPGDWRLRAFLRVPSSGSGLGSLRLFLLWLVSCAVMGKWCSAGFGVQLPGSFCLVVQPMFLARLSEDSLEPPILINSSGLIALCNHSGPEVARRPERTVRESWECRVSRLVMKAVWT